MTTVLSVAALVGVLTFAPVIGHAGEIDTEHLFNFTIGTDIGEVGEKEMEGQTNGRFGKRDGSYTALSQMLSAEFTPAQNFRLELSTFLAYHDIVGVTGIDDRRQGGLQGLSLELRYRLLDRAKAGFGVAIDAEPRWGRIDDVTGEPIDQYGVDLAIAVDKELIPNRVVAAFNLLYGPETTRSRVTGGWMQEATLGTSTALMARVRSGVFVGGEARYLRRYAGIGLNTLTGHALFLGPTVYAKLSQHSWIAASWSIQVAGRSADGLGPLDLVNFERHHARLLFGHYFLIATTKLRHHHPFRIAKENLDWVYDSDLAQRHP